MKTFHTICVFLGTALLALLIWEIGPRELWRDLSTLGWGLIPLVLIEGVADIFHTLGWRHCLNDTHRSIPFFRIFRIRLSGYSINYLTPTASLGGELTKGTLLTQERDAIGAVTGILVGKLAYTLAQLIFVSLGSLVVLWGIPLPSGLWPAMLASSALLAMGVFGFLLVQKYGKLGALVRWLVEHRVGGSLLRNAAHHVTEVDDELRSFYRQRPGDLPFAILWHITGLACGIVQTWYFLYLLADHASFAVAAGIWFLGGWFDFLTFAIPLGIGVQEATRVIALKAVGFDMAMGLAYGVTLRLEQIFWAIAGLLCYATLISEGSKGKLVPSKVEEHSRAFPG